jgi:Glycosyltransferase family 87
MSALLDPITHWSATLRQAIDRRLQPPFLWLGSGMVLAMGLVLLAVSFATSDRGRTFFGPALGADFAGFYAAAQILDRGQVNQLYDRGLHDRLYHELLPNLDDRITIPYVHPPLVAAALRPFAWLPYEAAFAVWLIVSGGLYLAGFVLIWRSCPGLPREHKWLALLLAVTFEPFLLECWMGGQLSAVGFFSLALAWHEFRAGRLFAAGLALGLCLYKPTFLVVFLPLLLWARQWRVLVGLVTTGFALLGLSVAAVGTEVCLGYTDVLLAFRQNTGTSGELELPIWKYVDLSSDLRLLFGASAGVQWGLLVLIALVPSILLLRAWGRSDFSDSDQQTLLWAAALTWTPVLNVYVGIYDSIVLVQSALLTADVLYRRRRADAPLCSSGLAYLLVLVAVTAWFSQSLARMIGIQVYTLAIALLGAYQLWLLAPVVGSEDCAHPYTTTQASASRSAQAVCRSAAWRRWCCPPPP